MRKVISLSFESLNPAPIEKTLADLKALINEANATNTIRITLVDQVPGTHAGDAPLGITPREVDVIRCLRAGMSNKRIARELDLTEGTVKVHVKSAFAKLGVSNRTSAALLASQLGIGD